MVVVSAPAIDKNSELFTHDVLMWAQGKPSFISNMVIHKEWIANTSEFESDFEGQQHGCTQASCPYLQKKTVRTPVYWINPTYGDIAVAYR